MKLNTQYSVKSYILVFLLCVYTTTCIKVTPGTINQETNEKLDITSFANIENVIQTKIELLIFFNQLTYENKEITVIDGYTKQNIQATAVIHYKTITNSDYIILDSNGLIDNIKSIKDKNGTLLEFEKYAPKNYPTDIGEGIKIYFSKTIDINTEDYLIIDYLIDKNSVGLNWHSNVLTENKNIPLISTKGEAINARSYIPCQDTPIAKVTVLTQIIFPIGVTAIFSGEEISKEEYTVLSKIGNNKYDIDLNIFQSKYYHMINPIPTYLITFVIGYLDSLNVDMCKIYFQKSPIETPQYILKKENIRKLYTKCKSYYEYFSSLKPFSFGLEKNLNKFVFVMLPFDFYSNGMENPYAILMNESLLTDDGSYEDVVAHEMAHFWSGNLVTCASWKYFWLNEGITTYLQRKAIKYAYKNYFYSESTLELSQVSLLDKSKYINNSKDSKNISERLNIGEIKYQQEIALAYYKYIKAVNESKDMKQELNRRLLEPTITGDPFMFYSRISYDKGSFLMTALENKIGEDKMNNFLSVYFNTFAFKSITGDDFRKLFNDTFKEVKFNFKEWLEDDSLPIEKYLLSNKYNFISELVSLIQKNRIESINIFMNLSSKDKNVVLSELSQIVKREKRNKDKGIKMFLKGIFKKDKNLNKQTLNNINLHYSYFYNKVYLSIIPAKIAIRKIKQLQWFNKGLHKQLFVIVAKENYLKAMKLLKNKRRFMNEFLYKTLSSTITQFKK